MPPESQSTRTLPASLAWELLRSLAALAKAQRAVETKFPLSIEVGSPVLCYADPEAPRSWSRAEGVSVAPEAAEMLDLYMPLCIGPQSNTLVVAHLGQSLDGRIATKGGVSQYITGQENLLHTHRMRALFDAVLVGAHTASNDNPQLTTRLAPGDHPTRVLIDPTCSVDTTAGIFTDGQAKTVVLCSPEYKDPNNDTQIAVQSEDGVLATSDILATLRGIGLHRIFIEGGGVTVSHFLQSRSIHRLQVCVAPMIIGSGRPSFCLPEVHSLEDGVFLKAKHFPSGDDILFDCQLLANE